MKEENPDNAPDMVIAGAMFFISKRVAFSLDYILSADTVVFTHAQPITSDTSYSVMPDANQELLEKPSWKEDNLRMLLDLNGGVCEVVTGLVVGAITSFHLNSTILSDILNHVSSFILQCTLLLCLRATPSSPFLCLSSWLKLTIVYYY